MLDERDEPDQIDERASGRFCVDGLSEAALPRLAVVFNHEVRDVHFTIVTQANAHREGTVPRGINRACG